ncbi:MAG: AAA family ATPase [Acidimicrobiia bacterium]|nr:AAA family ATPase [Acidimicrobiia bacterium]
MAVHPELAAEQAYIDRAYACLDATRRAASKMTDLVEVGRGGTEQARFERDVIWDTMAHRLSELELGDAALCFGRIDRPAYRDDAPHGEAADPESPNGDTLATDAYYIGRVAVSDDQREPVIVDWRAPVAEAFYRATGRQPLGLVRRRHFASRGRTLLNIDDELFGEAAAGLDSDGPTVAGHGALLAALETARTGRLGDIVATIQGEQDEIIRSPMPGVLVVQGGPGTGKTVVALHRAAYLLYTHRFPLEGQGVLVVGPNRLFLGYIEQVLPSLGEAGVELSVLADLLRGQAQVAGYDTGRTARVKGDPRMARLLARAVRDRQRPLREVLTVGDGAQTLRLTVEDSARIVAEARRRHRKHNAGRKTVESEVYAALARSGRREVDPQELRHRVRRQLDVRSALEWMWPVLTPEEFLNELFGSVALLRHAAASAFEEHEWRALHRPRRPDAAAVVWAHNDVPLLDEARALLGPLPKSRRRGAEDDDEVRTYGHILVDEAQDLSPMELRMLNRRSLNGSMTVVGDIAQATGQWAHGSWDEILELLPDRKPPRRAELTVGYRLPAPIMDLAARVLATAAPEVTPPRSVRQDGDPPLVQSATAATLASVTADVVRRELAAVGVGNVAVICATARADEVSAQLAAAGIDHGRATRHGLDSQVTVVPVSLVKGLELDAAVVVEPAAIVDEEAQGMRALYVALTRATKRLAVVHARPLPVELAGHQPVGVSAVEPSGFLH